MTSFRLIALSPPALADPSIAIAARRAGEMGVLDLEHLRDESTLLEAVRAFARRCRQGCGVKVGGHLLPALDSVLDDPAIRLDTLIVAAGGEERPTPERVARLRERGAEVLLEVTSVEEAESAGALGADGLIAKGNEAGGWVGSETSFILLQRIRSRTSLPVWAHGGIGLHTVGAAFVAGAAGAVLDSQLLLARESPIPEAIRDRIRHLDGADTICLGEDLGAACRFVARPGHPAAESLRRLADDLAGDGRDRAETLGRWREAVRERWVLTASDRHVWPLGQDATFAASLADRFLTVGGILRGVRQALGEHVRQARALRPLGEGSSLARSHGTRYPIVQGPMTRVSDGAAFALAVAEAGALPFLALALMRAPTVRDLLERTRRSLGGRPWGVGILGFVPPELRQEQLEAIRSYAPRYALIAGGRPDQARELENDGIATYLHVPSPELLRLFLRDGARRFVFEGRECGGHVGPRSSFVLWESMLEVLLRDAPAGETADCHVLFAGGIHDALSASMVSAIASTAAARGVNVGVLLGTAYLFTREAVATGAISAGFQEQALRCRRTVLASSGPGHAVRMADTPYAQEFERERRRLLDEGRSPEEIRRALEELNLGRLRIASRGIRRHPLRARDPSAPEYEPVSPAEQVRQGMYMIGQLAALRDRACGMLELHQEVAVEGSRRLAEAPDADSREPAATAGARRSEVAIVGMSCILPKAHDLRTYWENILGKVNAITEVPRDRWDWQLYFDPDPATKDKIYSRWGGFLEDEPFDPVEFGMPPNSMQSIDPTQLLSLKAARAALDDAGYLRRTYDRNRTSVILGASGGTGDLGAGYVLRSTLPLLLADRAPAVISGAGDLLPEWTEDSFAGLLLNVAAGRIANRFDLGGVNCVVDAACASSLAAVHLALRELESGESDMVLVGGVDTTQNPFGFLCFSKTRALSPSGNPNTFDASADGIAISEGVVMLVLKRLRDAERDGDRIYAVIQAVAGSSDGRAKGLTAPRPEGQLSALRRAYAKAGVSPATVALFEAHGTGTVVGDRTEAASLSTLLQEAGVGRQSAAVGSVKSMIGHTKAAAGVAGLAKVALALHHKILPPTRGVTDPNPKSCFIDGPLYVNSESRPWIHSTAEHPRRAGVSAFGFGGTNFHAVVEEYTEGLLAADAPERRWPGELLLWSGRSRAEVAAALEPLERALGGGARPELRDLSHTLWLEASERLAGDGHGALCLAIVASDAEDLREKVARARKALASGNESEIDDPRGIYFTERPLARDGRVVFLFPGQGSQYLNMIRDLAIHFPEVREEFERADRALVSSFPRPLSGFVFPPPAFTREDERRQQDELTRTNVAQPALGAASLGVLALLRRLGVEPAIAAGHSYGEYTALCAGSVIDPVALAKLSEARGRCILEAAKDDLGTMAAVEADAQDVAAALSSLEEVWIANLNAPRQTVISGTRGGLERAIGKLKEAGMRARPVSVSCAFHSPLVAAARDRFVTVLAVAGMRAPRIEVFSNTTARPHSSDPEAIRAQLADHLVKPVRFAEEIEAMYATGARIFLEVGPRNILTGLVQQILDGRPRAAVAVDVAGRSGIVQLLHALAVLAAHGVPVRLGRLFEGRSARRLDPGRLLEDTREAPLSSTTWMVTGGRVRPGSRPEKPAATAAASAPVADPSRAAQGGPLSSARPGERSAGAIPPGAVAEPVGTAPNPNPSGALGAATAPEGDAGHVMLEFNRLMGRFLETQQAVMSAYLTGRRLPGSLSEADGSEDVASPARRRDAGPALEAAPLAAPVPVAPEEAPPPPPLETSGTGRPLDLAEGAPPLAGREPLTRQLVRIVSERTGYPEEMLGLDVDMEADLGIDSIKRVEILGNVQRACLPPGVALGDKAMDQLSALKTLRGIADWLAAVVGQETPAGPGGDQVGEKAGAGLPPSGSDASAVEAPSGMDAAPPPEIPRSTRVAEELPLDAGRRAPLPRDRVVLLTDDERGVARCLAERLERGGIRAVLLRQEARGAGGHVLDGNVGRGDLTDCEAVAHLVAAVRAEAGPVGGLVHARPLRSRAAFESTDLASWREDLLAGVKSFFYLLRAAAADLASAAEEDGTFVLSALPLAPEPAGPHEPSSPADAGLAGLVKTLALEWPGVRCKAVGLEASTPADVLADRLFGECTAVDGEIEVAYRGAGRWIYRPKPAPIARDLPASLELGADSVVLLTGGARGITAEVACHLARRYGLTLVLVGSSPPPANEESPDTKGRSSPREVKAALMERLRSTGQPVGVRQVEAAFGSLMKEREIRASIARIREAGARVEYVQADVRDGTALASRIEDLYRRLGRIDGVVHAAGVIEDKLLAEKSPDSFDRVLDTKSVGAFLLTRLLRPESLRFIALFASAAGTFGNRGQADYAAANEVLNALARRLDRTWPGRVVSINWGPWDKTGMVSAELRAEFARRGIPLIPIPDGCRMLDEELRHGGKGEAEVILAGGAWEAPAPRRVLGADRRCPLLRRATLTRLNGSVEVVRELDPSRDVYLMDHRMDDRPVLPVAMAVELMAEVAQGGWPDFEVTGVRDLRVLKGIVLEQGPRTIRVSARKCSGRGSEPAGIDVEVELSDVNGGGRPFYKTTVELGERLPAPPALPASSTTSLKPFPMTVIDAYRKWLFHGPIFQAITQIDGIADREARAVVLPSSPKRCLAGGGEGAWLIDPVVFDSGLQLFILWARHHLDKTPLPSRFRHYRRFGTLDRPSLKCHLRVLESSQDPVFHIDVWYVGSDGLVAGVLEDFEGACSASLNRLGVKEEA